jgi:hypothetical protein
MSGKKVGTRFSALTPNLACSPRLRASITPSLDQSNPARLIPERLVEWVLEDVSLVIAPTSRKA